MKKRIASLFLSVVMLLSMCLNVSAAEVTHNLVQGSGGAARFTDVPRDYTFYNDIDAVVGSGLFAGTTATTFSPHREMTRAMFVVVLSRLEGHPELENQVTATVFSDVPSTRWAAGAIAWANSNGIVEGYTLANGTREFRPDTPISRAQICALVDRYIRYKGYTLREYADATARFTDASMIPEVFRESVERCRVSGLIRGFADGYLRPNIAVTRAQVAAILNRIITVTFDENTENLPVQVPGAQSGGEINAVNGTTTWAVSRNGQNVANYQAAAGDLVTLTFNPDAGYMVGTVSVKDANGADVPVTMNGPRSATFTMPSAMPVSVGDPYVPIYSFTDASQTNGNSYVSLVERQASNGTWNTVATGTSDGELSYTSGYNYIDPGDRFTVSHIANTYYQHLATTVRDNRNSVVTSTRVNDSSTTFILPEQLPVVIDVSYGAVSSGGGGGGGGGSSYRATTLAVNLDRGGYTGEGEFNGYTITRVGTSPNLTLPSGFQSEDYAQTNANNTNYDGKALITLNPAEGYNVKVVYSLDGAEKELEDSDTTDSAFTAEFDIPVRQRSSAHRVVLNVTYSTGSVEPGDTATLNVTLDRGYNAPANFNTASISSTTTLTGDAVWSLTENVTNATKTLKQGETVTVTLNNVDPDYQPTVTKNNGSPLNNTSTNGGYVYTFTMDAATVSLNITFTRTVSYLKLNITQPEGAENGVTLGGAGLLATDISGTKLVNSFPIEGTSERGYRMQVGQTVTVAVNLTDGYRVNTFSLSTAHTGSNTSGYTFTVPEQDVILSVDFVSADTPYDVYTVNVSVNPSNIGAALKFRINTEDWLTLPNATEGSSANLPNTFATDAGLLYFEAPDMPVENGTYKLKTLFAGTADILTEGLDHFTPDTFQEYATDETKTEGTYSYHVYTLNLTATFELEQNPPKAVSYRFHLSSYDANGVVESNPVTFTLTFQNDGTTVSGTPESSNELITVNGAITDFALESYSVDTAYQLVTSGNQFEIRNKTNSADGSEVWEKLPTVSEDPNVAVANYAIENTTDSTDTTDVYDVYIRANVEAVSAQTYSVTQEWYVRDSEGNETAVSNNTLSDVTVTLDKDPARYAENETVTVTITTTGSNYTFVNSNADGSMVSKYIYTGAERALTPGTTDGTYTFTMPSDNVTLHLVFEQNEEPPVTYTVTVESFIVGSEDAPNFDDAEYYSLSDENGYEIDPNAVPENTVVTLTVITNSYDFNFGQTTVKETGNADDAGDHSKTETGAFSFTFKVDADLTVRLAFEEKNPALAYLTVSVTNKDGGTVTVNGETVTGVSYKNTYTKADATTVTIIATPNADYEVWYRTGSEEYKKLEAPNITVTMDGDKSVDIEFRSLKNYTLTVVMEENPNANASVTVEYFDRSGNPVSAPYSAPVTTIPEGYSATVTVTNDPTYYPYYRIYKTADGSGNAEWTSYTNAVTVPDENGFDDDYTFEVEFRQTIKLQLVIDTTGGKGTATATYGDNIELKVSNRDDDLAKGERTSRYSTTDPISEETITVTWEGDSDFESLTVNGEPVTVSGNSYSFNPKDDTVVKVKFVYVPVTSKLTLTTNDGGNSTVTIDGTDLTNNGTADVDEKTDLTLNINKDNAYRIKSVKVDGKDVTLKNGAYTFKMPNHNTDVDVVFEAKTYTVNLVLNDASGAGSATANNTDFSTGILSNVDYGTSVTVMANVNNSKTQDKHRVSSIVFQPEGQAAQNLIKTESSIGDISLATATVTVACDDDDVDEATITVNITDANLRDFTLNYTGTGEFSADIVGTRDGNTVTERVTHKTAGNPVSVTKNSDTTTSTVTVKVTLDDTIITGATLNGADYTDYTENDDGTVTFEITMDDDTVLTLALEETVWGYNMYAGLDFGKLTDYNFRVFDIPETDDLMEAMHRINDNTEDGNTDTQNADVVARFLSAFGDELSKVKSEIPVTDEQLIRSMIDKEARAKATDTVNQYVKNLDPSGESEIPQTMKDQVSELIIDQIEPALANLPFPVTRDDVEVNWEGGQFNVNVLNEGGIDGFTQALLDCLGFEIGSEIKVVLNAVPNNTTHMLKMSAVLQEIDVNVSVDTDNLPKLQFEGRGNLSFTVKLKSSSYDLTGMLAEAGITVENGVATVPINSGRQEIELTDINKIAGTIHSDPRYVDISSLLNADQIGRLTDNFYNKIDKIDSAEVRTAVYALFDPDSKYVDEPFVHFEMVEDGESTILQSIKVHTYEILSLDAPQNGERLRLTIDLDPAHWNEIIDEAIDRVNAVREAIIADTATYNPPSRAFVGHIGNGKDSGYTVYINTALEDIYTNNQKVANALALSNPTMKQFWKALKPSLNADMTKVELDVDTALSFGDGAMAQIADILIQAFANPGDESIDLNLYWRLERSQIPSTDN